MTNKLKARMTYSLVAALMVTMFSQSAQAAYNGLQVIGFSKYSTNDVNSIADIYKRVGGDLEIRLLPHEFNPSDPYKNIDNFVRRVLPGLNGRLRVVLYGYKKDQSKTCGDLYAFDYNAFNGQTTFRSYFLDTRITPMDNWVKQIWSWAVSRGLQSKLSFKVAPVLEDKWTGSNSAFELLFGAINYRQVNTDRVPVDIAEFRSPEGKLAPRIGNYRLELHGYFTDVSGRLQSGDMYSNDGTTYNRDSDFASAQRTALSRGIDVAWWIPEFNNKDQNQGDPCKRSFNLSSQMSRIESMLRAR